MNRLRVPYAWLLSALGLLAGGLVLSGGPRTAFAEDARPTSPPPSDPAMGEPAMGEAAGGGADDEGEDELPTGLNAQIEAAINKGVQYLKRAQLPDGSWGLIEGDRAYGGGETKGQEYKHPAGATALVLYTLLKCKVPYDDPYVKKGFAYLRSKQKIPGGSYECAMVLLAVTAVADPFKKVKASESQGDKVKFPSGDWREWAQKLHDTLLDKRRKGGKNLLGWRYQNNTNPAPGGEQDLSSTQLAALSLLAAERCGIKTDSKVWNDIITFAMAQQEDDGPEWPRAVYDRPPKGVDVSKLPDAERGRYGPPPGAPKTEGDKDKARGFCYIKSEQLEPREGKASGGMTACGIGSIVMSRYVLMKRDDPAFKARDQKAIQQSIYDGCAWLDANWSPWENPRSKYYGVYYLYCCERAFDLIGNLRLGNKMWYAEMASQLVGRQNKEKGFWESGTTHKPREILDTSFALLFLKRSTKGGIPYGSITGGGDEPPADNRGR